MTTKIEDCESLDEVRTHIDRLDRELVRLMAERSGYVRQAARFKDNREEVVDRERIDAIVAVAREQAREMGLDPDVAEDVFRAMIDRFIAYEYVEFDRLHESAER